MTASAKYKTTLGFLQTAGTSVINQMILELSPEASFGLFTYEDDDVETGHITYCLYNNIPEMLAVTVPYTMPLTKAIYEIQCLNTHVRLVISGNAFVTCNEANLCKRVQLLLVISNSLSVNNVGVLSDNSSS